MITLTLSNPINDWTGISAQEFTIWKKSSIATIIALICTLFKFLDIPVFWPVLLVNAILLLAFAYWRKRSSTTKGESELPH
jgi:hypothetical protein